MARRYRLRLWQKKRGNRRTGSQLAGSLGEVMFSGTVFLLGVVSLTALIASQTLSDSPPFQPGFGFWVMVLVLSSFILLGGGGVIWTVFHVSASRERRSALAKRAAGLDLSGQPTRRHESPPTVPSDANLTNSPGVNLRYRLPIIQSPAWRLVTAASFCLIWNGCAAVLTVLAINGYWEGRPEWFLMLFTLPFLLIGGWSVRDFLRLMRYHTGFGPTNLEISDHPLEPDREYDIYISQAGRLTVRSLSLSLICEEVATYRQGTDIRTEHRSVFDRQIFRRTDIEIEPGVPFEHECRLHIPAEAMHSFQSEHNAVNWRLEVRARAESRPSYERCFPIVVFPANQSDEYVNRTAHRVAHR